MIKFSVSMIKFSVDSKYGKIRVEIGFDESDR